MSERPYIFDDTRHQAELERLRMLEGVFDPATSRHLRATGIGAGWRCLEVGAGAGSIAHWMCDVVGPTGHVLAVDVNARFLPQTGAAPLEVREADIRAADIGRESFDLAHARFVLIHVPDWSGVIAAMTACLKPGGWLVLEEPDFSCARSFAGPPDLRRSFDNVHRAIGAMFAQRGMDHAFGARLPAVLQERGLTEMSIANDAAIVPGGSTFARMLGLSAVQLREKYLATGLASEQDLESYQAFIADPTCWATYHATITAAGRKPTADGAARAGR